MTGKELKKLMRINKVTIRELKRRTGICLNRIRYRLTVGLDDGGLIRDWVEAITGKDPGPISFVRSVDTVTFRTNYEICTVACEGHVINDD